MYHRAIFYQIPIKLVNEAALAIEKYKHLHHSTYWIAALFKNPAAG